MDEKDNHSTQRIGLNLQQHQHWSITDCFHIKLNSQYTHQDVKLNIYYASTGVKNIPKCM